MHLQAQIAKHFRDVHFGGNWTSVNLKNTFEGLTWQEATTQVYNFNTIATLVFHTNYYVCAITKVLQGEILQAHDTFSFETPSIQSQSELENLFNKTFTDAENFALLIEQLPETALWEDFSENKYGNFYRNIVGIIEHLHYHLGQIVLIKKIIKGVRNTEK